MSFGILSPKVDFVFKKIFGNEKHINIEIQVKNEYNMIKRSLYYWSKMYEGQLTKGQDYDTLSIIICINVID